jgi:catechol 2,3-dioxygenase-like lactoylglutathione lyase family enzyme
MKPTLEKAWGYQGDNMNRSVRDLATALPFYETVLGFRVLSRSVTPHNSAVLARDQVEIGHAENGGDPTQDGCAFHVNGLADLFAEFKASGLQKELSEFDIEEHDGVAWKVFYIVAPDGLCYWFGERHAGQSDKSRIERDFFCEADARVGKIRTIARREGPHPGMGRPLREGAKTLRSSTSSPRWTCRARTSQCFCSPSSITPTRVPARLDAVAAEFHEFDLGRLRHSRAVENPGRRMQKPDRLTLHEVRSVMLEMPFRKVEQRKYLKYDKEDLACIRFQSALWRQLIDLDRGTLGSECEKAIAVQSAMRIGHKATASVRFGSSGSPRGEHDYRRVRYAKLGLPRRRLVRDDVYLSRGFNREPLQYRSSGARVSVEV